MNGDVHTCLAGCGKRITWRFAICSDCEKIYGRSPDEWSMNGASWLRWLWNEEQRNRRREKNETRFETLVGIRPTRNGDVVLEGF